jgi:Cobalamin-independent synthase, Catalytic domain
MMSSTAQFLMLDGQSYVFTSIRDAICSRERRFAVRTNELPVLPTSVVGSYALPPRLYAADDWIGRGLFGPVDAAETADDAVDRAILDQERTGIDIVSDGEMRRRGFVQSFISRVTGLMNVGASRKVGEVGLDLVVWISSFWNLQTARCRRSTSGHNGLLIAS